MITCKQFHFYGGGATGDVQKAVTHSGKPKANNGLNHR